MVKRGSSTRLFLDAFVASIVVNAALGIWALLSGDFGETQGKILGTSFLLSAAMLAVLVNIPALRRRCLWPAPAIGAATGAAGFALFVVLLWTEAGDDRWFRLAGSFLVVAAAATLASSLTLIEIPALVGWLRVAGNGLIALLAATILYGIWFDPGAAWYARSVGVQGVLVAASTLLIPVLSRFMPSGQLAASHDETTPAAVRFCPLCGRPTSDGQRRLGVAVSCGGCGLDFEVTTSAGGPSTRRSPAGPEPHSD